MTRERCTQPPFYSQIDVSNAGQPAGSSGSQPAAAEEQSRLLREILASQDRQNELLEELVTQIGAGQRQRAVELGEWKQANPHLAHSCRAAAESLSRVQTEFLASLTQEISDNFDALLDGEFMLNEFVDRFGPRLAHLNGVLQVLTQLSSTPSPANTPNSP